MIFYPAFLLNLNIHNLNPLLSPRFGPWDRHECVLKKKIYIIRLDYCFTHNALEQSWATSNMFTYMFTYFFIIYSIEHLFSPRAENIRLPEGQKRDNQSLGRSSAVLSSLNWEDVSSSFCSNLSEFSWISPEFRSSPSIAPASEISPGFLSNSPLNCFLAFFSTSCR